MAFGLWAACAPFGGGNAADEPDAAASDGGTDTATPTTPDAGPRCTITACPLEELFVFPKAYYLESDDRFLYVGSRNNAVTRFDKTDGTTTPIVYGGGADPRSPVTRDGNVWVPAESGVFYLPGGVAPVSVTSSPTSEVLLDGDSVYGCHYDDTTAQNVVRYRTGTTTVLTSVKKCESLATANGALFFGGDAIHRLPLSTATTVSIDRVTKLGVVARRLAVDDTFVYSVAQTSAEVRRVSQDLTSVSVIATLPEAVDESDIHVDGEDLYVGSRHSLWRVNKRNGALELIAENLENVVGIATDAAYVYWSEFDTGRVRRRKK